MATRRFTSFHGTRMRLTRVDACGRPVYGVCSQVVTKGFISVEVTGEVKEGDDLEMTNASGELCLSEKSADQLKWLNLALNFCEVDPDIILLLNPTYTALFDYEGNTIGFAESNTQDLAQGVAVELWADVSGADLCDDPNATQNWVYFLIPWVVGAMMGDETIENAGLTVQMNARSHLNSKWGVGPYDVMLAGLGDPGPLLVPVAADEPRRRFLTSVAPPEDEAGCQPLSNPAGPTATVEEGATAMTTEVTVVGAGNSVNWGDGSAPAVLAAGVPLSHLYAAPGTYNVSVYTTLTPQMVTVYPTEIPWP